MTLTHEQPIWFDKCVESYTWLPLHGTWASWAMYFIFCTMNTSYRVNFPLLSKTMCIHLVGDSNTKCTHLGGVHPMVCDFETNMFTSLSFVVSYWAMVYGTKLHIQVHRLCAHALAYLGVPSVLHFKDFQLVFNFNWYHDKSPSNWYIQDNKVPRRYAWTIILSIGILVNSLLF